MTNEEATVFLKNGDGEPLNVTCGLNELPSAEPKKGKWIYIYNKGYIPYNYQCSECGARSILFENYCPNCGADMRGES